MLMTSKVKNAEIKIVDGKTILDITYITYIDDMTYEVIIPQIVLNEIEFDRELFQERNRFTSYFTGEKAKWSFNALPDKDESGSPYYYKFKLCERTVAKTDLEKELGYKLNIV